MGLRVTCNVFEEGHTIGQTLPRVETADVPGDVT